MCEQQGLSVAAACKLFGHSRQAYYKAKTDYAEQRRRELAVLDSVREIRAEDIRIGGYKLWLMVKNIFPNGWIQGRDSFYKLLAHNHLMLLRPKPRHTTNSNHRFHKYGNLIKGIIPMRPNEIWVADITYVDVDGEVCYLHLITDAYSHKILGWILATSLAAANTREACFRRLRRLDATICMTSSITRTEVHNIVVICMSPNFKSTVL